MEAVLLGLCFGSCLKGEGNSNELYEALEVERSASTEDIRQAFRKKTLQLHPDKLAQRGKQVTVEDSARFVKAKEAFDILSDSKRRKRYDQIGLLGLKLIENPREMNPSELIKNFKRNQTDRLKVAVFLGLVFLIILIFPVIFALKCDNLLGYSPWTLIWVPIWIVDFLLLIAACLLCGASNELDDDDNEPIEHVTVTTKVINFLETVMFILIQIFTLMRLDKDISWSWAATFSPWYAYEFFGICSLIGPALQVLVIPRGDASVVQLEDGAEVDPNLVEQVQYFEKLVNKISSNVQIVCSLIRLWQAIFLAIKLDNGSWNWGLVLLPTWAYFAFQLMVSQYYKCVSKRLVNGLSLTEIQMQLQSGTDIHPLSSLKYQQYEQLSATGTTVVCAQIVPLFVALMLVCRLEVSDYSTFLIILPAVIYNYVNILKLYNKSCAVISLVPDCWMLLSVFYVLCRISPHATR
jgi:hypothetical protein